MRFIGSRCRKERGGALDQCRCRVIRIGRAGAESPHRARPSRVGPESADDVDVSVAVLSHNNKTMDGGITLVQKVANLTRQHLKY